MNGPRFPARWRYDHAPSGGRRAVYRSEVSVQRDPRSRRWTVRNLATGATWIGRWGTMAAAIAHVEDLDMHHRLLDVKTFTEQELPL